jgi:hypothetical protein
VTAVQPEPAPLLAWLPTTGPLVSVYLDDDDPMWSEGPWRLLWRAAMAADWVARGFFSRSKGLTAAGVSTGLVDALSVRFDKGDRAAVGIWTRTTWPTMGRAAARQADSDRTEGRRDSTGKTWLWHPPMAAPDSGVPEGRWSFSSGWLWPTDAAVQPERVQARDVKEWIIR